MSNVPLSTLIGGKNRQQLVVLLITILGIVSVAGFGIVPGIRAIQLARISIAERQAVISLLNSKFDFLDALDNTLLSMEVQGAIAAVPLTTPYQSVLALLQELSKRHSVGFGELELSRETLSGKALLQVRMGVVGSYDSLMGFVGDLEQALPLAQVRSVELSQSTGGLIRGDQASVYSAKIALSFLSDEAPKTIGKPSDRLPVITEAMKEALNKIESFEVIPTPQAQSSASGSITHLFPE